MISERLLEAIGAEASNEPNPQDHIDKRIFHLPEDLVPYEDKKAWLRSYVLREFDLVIPDRAVVKGNSAPLDFIADIVFQKVRNALVVANRDGGKTFDLAVIHAINSRFNDGNETLSVGAVASQANKCYSYYKQFIKSPSFQEIYQVPLTTVSTLRNGSSVQFIPGTMNALNSPHPHIAVFDEVELANKESLEEFYSMTKSDEAKGIVARNVLASTRKFAYGIVQQTMDEIQSGNKPGWALYQWSIWEIMKPFQLKEEWKSVTKRTKEGGLVSFYDIAKPYAGKTNGFFDPEDAVSKFSSMSYDTWLAQWECKKPSREGLVYGAEYDPADELQENWEYDPDYPVFSGQDFGDTNPMVTLYAQLLSVEEARNHDLGILPETGSILVYFDEVYVNKISASNYAKTYLIPKDNAYDKALGAYDPSGAGFAREMKEASDERGRTVAPMKPVKCTVEEGIQLVKTMHEQHRVKVSPKMVNYKREKLLYHYIPDTDKPAKEDDHSQDAERYLQWMLFGKKEETKSKVHGSPILIGSSNRLV